MGYHTREKHIVVDVLIVLLLVLLQNCNAWVLPLYSQHGIDKRLRIQHSQRQQQCLQPLHHSATNIDKDSLKENTASSSTTKTDAVVNEIPYDYEIPEDAVIHIKPAAMRRLRELRDQQIKENTLKEGEYLTLRMGVRSGGCSGMSYVMDFCSTESINDDDDQIDLYESDRIQCVVDSKSMLYLYGLQLDYSTELIGGGFKFYNPNAEESCGCGSSFGV